MRSEFDNAFLEHIRLHRNESKKEIANWAFSYRQTEVDELQKRVDAVKQLIQEYHRHSYREADDFVFYLEQALKDGE